jgi:hypothetical protein
MGIYMSLLEFRTNEAVQDGGPGLAQAAFISGAQRYSLTPNDVTVSVCLLFCHPGLLSDPVAWACLAPC